MDKIKRLQEMIDECNNIVFFGGAGVSTDSGLKDFKGKDGLYTTSKEERPEYMLSTECFYNEPERFYEYYKENFDCKNIEPNATHKYLAALEKKGKLKGVVTQNIDGLHQKAGSNKVYEVHGTIATNHCIECNKEYPSDYVFNSKGIPKCDCGGIIKPDVVLYGERLPKAFSESQFLIMKADMLIVAGTSLTVQPASGLVSLFNGKYLVIINNSDTDYDDCASLVIHDNLKDVFSNLK